MFDFRVDLFIHRDQFLIHADTRSDKPLVKVGGEQSGYFIRTHVLSQAILNSPNETLTPQHVQRVLSA